MATKLLGMRRQEMCFRSLVVAVSSQSRACWCHSPQEWVQRLMKEGCQRGQETRRWCAVVP